VLSVLVSSIAARSWRAMTVNAIFESIFRFVHGLTSFNLSAENRHDCAL